MESRENKFATVPFVLGSIIIMCAVFPGLQLKAVKPLIGALAIICWGAIPHWIGLAIAIRKGGTVAAGVIGLFAGFWTFLALGLLLAPADLGGALVWIEPGMIAILVVLQHFYRQEKMLQHILLGLAGLIAILWLSKLFSLPACIVPGAVYALGLWALVVLFFQLKKAVA